MKYPIVSLHCFHVVGLSITAAFEPAINMEHEAIIFFLKYFFGFIDSAAEDMTGNRGREGGVTLSKGTQAGSGTQVRCRVSAWDACSTK